MPFKNLAQMRACFAQNNPKWDCHKWAHETPNLKSLPEHAYGGMLDYRRKACLKCGGKPKKQDGGCFDAMGNSIPCQGQQLPGTNNNWQVSPIPTNIQPPVNPDPAYTIPINDQGDKAGYDVKPIRQKANGNWVIKNKGKVDPFKVALGLQGTEVGLTWLSEMADRKRQNQYLYNQYSTLGQTDALPASNFQPNPYNLYAKYGGSLNRYRNYIFPIYTNNAENAAIDDTDGKMQFGGINMKKNPFSSSSKYGGGGLSREKNYGSASKPYPSVAASDFAGGDRSYPIPTRADAIDALRLAHLHGRSDVIAKIHAKYPELRRGGMIKKTHKKHVMDTDHDMDQMMDNDMDQMKKGGKWLQGAINPSHKGWCTPLSNPHCTGHRRAFALMMKKKHGFQ